MGRKPRNIQAIADRNQQVNFMKHKTGLLKKAHILSKMFDDYEVAVIFVSNKTNQISPYANVNLEKLLSDILEQKIPTESINNQDVVKKTMKKGRKVEEFGQNKSTLNGDPNSTSAMPINPLIRASVIKSEQPKNISYPVNVIGVADSFNNAQPISMQKQHCDSAMEIFSNVKSNQMFELPSAHFSPMNDGLAISKYCPLSQFCRPLSSSSGISNTSYSFQTGGYKLGQLPMSCFAGGVTNSNMFWKSGQNEPNVYSSSRNCASISAVSLDDLFPNASSGTTYTTMQGGGNIGMNNYNFMPYPYTNNILPNPPASNPLYNPIFMPGPW